MCNSARLDLCRILGERAMSADVDVVRILSRGLLDIRIASIDGNNTAVFLIADFLHQVPCQMEHILREGGAYCQIVSSLRERAKIKGMEKWLDNALRDM